MHSHTLEQLLRNIDARATRISQLLPALSTRKELLEAIDSTASRLATKEELREAHDAVRAEVRRLAEQVLAIQQRLDDRHG